MKNFIMTILAVVFLPFRLVLIVFMLLKQNPPLTAKQQKSDDLLMKKRYTQKKKDFSNIANPTEDEIFHETIITKLLIEITQRLKDDNYRLFPLFK